MGDTRHLTGFHQSRHPPTPSSVLLPLILLPSTVRLSPYGPSDACPSTCKHNHAMKPQEPITGSRCPASTACTSAIRTSQAFPQRPPVAPACILKGSPVPHQYPPVPHKVLLLWRRPLMTRQLIFEGHLHTQSLPVQLHTSTLPPCCTNMSHCSNLAVVRVCQVHRAPVLSVTHQSLSCCRYFSIADSFDLLIIKYKTEGTRRERVPLPPPQGPRQRQLNRHFDQAGHHPSRDFHPLRNNGLPPTYTQHPCTGYPTTRTTILLVDATHQCSTTLSCRSWNTMTYTHMHSSKSPHHLVIPTQPTRGPSCQNSLLMLWSPSGTPR